MKWFQVSVRKLVGMSADKADLKKLEDALDFKYGNYDYAEDARSVPTVEFREKFQSILESNIGSLKGKKILLAGSNNGYELPFLDGAAVTAFDLSSKALNNLKKNYPKTDAIHGNMENLPFKDEAFDAYISLRAVHSSNIDLEKALLESLRVTHKGGALIYSISNAYRNNGNLIKGMYITATQTIDEKKPYIICEKILNFLNDRGIKSEVIEIPTEIFVTAQKR